jgi:hypothetical protein
MMLSKLMPLRAAETNEADDGSVEDDYSEDSDP